MDIFNDSLIELSANISALLCELDLENYTIFCLNHSPRTFKELDQTVRIFLYSFIFLLSVLGNTLVITVLIRNKRIRTVTNLFLLSLAISDLMLCFFCMPFTLIPNLLQDFIFGSPLCKITSYFMGVSVSVSTFSLVAISLERYSAICKPLQSRVWQTKSHALKVIAATWCLSFVIMTPYPIYSTLVPSALPNSTVSKCRINWPSTVIEQSWYIFQLLILFLIPGIVMMIAYGLISLELYRGIKFDASNRKSSRERKASESSRGRYDDGDGCYLKKNKKQQQQQIPLRQLSSISSCSNNQKIDRPRSSSSSANLMAKKLVIRMLIVIVILFFICWTPIFSVNTWRAFDSTSAQLLLSGAPISFIHLLSYTSACVNPIVYCFMNKRFRLGFLATFTCCAKPRLPAARAEMGEDEEGKTTRASLSRYSYTHMNMAAPP
ncbi:cholecystokinin receptor type A [Ahaetulla prasina]|uniref:cholecystokinin receptor type A n=1 Tax=Ahaetulla prasina TaxID=499056 RepID=UPI002647A9D6|nr:cholecystokinin receptor type A [Ahaetulla prasina]